MNVFRHLSLSSVALLGALAAGCAGEPPAAVRDDSVRPTGTIPPYVAHAAELDDSGGSRLETALRAIDGVEGVEVELEARRASVEMTEGVFLYDAQVRAAFAAADVEFGSFQPPAEALVTVYVVEAAGGG